MINRIDNALKHVRNGEYTEALNILNKQILPLMDGCTERGEPDTNLNIKETQGPTIIDWITDCAAQQAVYPLIVEAIDLLENLM